MKPAMRQSVKNTVKTYMADTYGWTLKQAELVATDVLPVDCVFDGYCEFPPSRMDLTQGDYFKEEKEDA